ncbi:MAG: hypothetical protein O3C40_35800 [Planctomycetota bacterium]|nr:hypothetical protein [Planctomycetota bacterium]
MSKTPESHSPPADSHESLTAWARDLVAAVGKRQARKALEDYKRLAADRRLTKDDRAIARKQAKALAELL